MLFHSEFVYSLHSQSPVHLVVYTQVLSVVTLMIRYPYVSNCCIVSIFGYFSNPYALLFRPKP